MDREKTVDFSVIKQKIIKTDEILRMYVEMSNKFKKAQQACKEIKLQLDQTVTNFGRIQLEHERCTFNIENLKQRNDILDKENKELREQKLVLEEQYNQQTVQSQLNIKSLQDDLQILRDLKYAAENLSPKKKKNTINLTEKKIENDVNNKNYIKTSENLTPDAVSENNLDTVNNLHICGDLLKEKTSQSQVESTDRYCSASSQTPDEVITAEHLKSLTSDSNSGSKFNKQNFVEQKSCRLTKNVGIQTHKCEPKKRSIHIQTTETMKTFQLYDVVVTENRQLKQRILKYDTEIIKLRVTESMKKSCYTQTEEMEIEDELVEDMLREMSMPRILSPLSPSINETLNLGDTCSSALENINNPLPTVPEILVIPPTPMKKTMETDFSFDEEQRFGQEVELLSDGNSLIQSSIRPDKINAENPKFPRRYKYRSPVIRNDFVKLRKSYIRKLTKKKHILNKEIMKIRKLRRQDYLLKTLCTLKHLKINFTISNDSIFPKDKYDRDFSYTGKGRNERKAFPVLKKAESYLTEQLNCVSKKCNHSNMLLSNTNGEIKLLGFYNIKSEVNTPASSRMENIWDTKSFDTLKLINSSLNVSNNTPESVLETLAEMVSRKLHEKEKNISKSHITSNQSDAFCSETETEIERLFYNSNYNVLERNKMLLETAKKQNQTLNLPVLEKREHHSEKKGSILDSSYNPLNKNIAKFEECTRPLSELKESECFVHAEDSSCISDNLSIENDSFEVPSCPQLLSPIKSVKNLEIPKKCRINTSCENESTSFTFNDEFKNSAEMNGMLDNSSELSELHNGESNKIVREMKKPQQDCTATTDQICMNYNLTMPSNVYQDDSTNLSSKDLTDMNLDEHRHEEINHFQYHGENLSLLKANETVNNDTPENTNLLLNNSDIKSCSPHTINFLENQGNWNRSLTNEKSKSEDVPSCPESPVPADINVEVKSPIVIPLEKLDKQEDIKDCGTNQKDMVSSFSTEVPNNENMSSIPKKIVRRSVRISERKKCSQSSECSKSNNTKLNESLSEKSQDLVEHVHSNSSMLLLPNSLNKSKLQKISKKTCKSIVSLEEGQAESLNADYVPKLVDEHSHLSKCSMSSSELNESLRERSQDLVEYAQTNGSMLPLPNSLSKSSLEKISKKTSKNIVSLDKDRAECLSADHVPKIVPEYSQSSKCSKNRSKLNETSQDFVEHVHSNCSMLPLPDPLNKSTLLETSKKTSKGIESLDKDQAECLGANHVPKLVDDCNETTVATSSTRKSISKLKSQVLKQLKLKRQMYKISSDHRILKTINTRSATNNSKPIMQGNKSVNKINIVQNILIPANSDYALDLLKKNENFEVNKNCDIRLDNELNSSQSDRTILNFSSNKEKDNGNNSNVPIKKKRVEHTQMDCDILSKIMGEMDKDRPEIILKEKKQSHGSKEIIPDSTDEKQWRKGVLVIAENIHNILPKPKELGEHIINKCKVYNPRCKSTLKRKVLTTRLLKLSSDENIPDEIILEFKRQDVNSIAEMVLQKVSFDICDKPDDKYYPAPLMTKTQRILLALMVRLERENVENVMDTFLSKAEAFLFEMGCEIRILIPITRLYMAVCKLRRDIDKMRSFCCDAFLFMGDMAVPLFFTVLTSWIEVLPMEPDLKKYPLAKVLVHIVHLKNCKKPGHNLFPLKLLLNQFYGYPTERWNCEEIFEELFQQYLKNPDKSSDAAIRLLCKNKDTKWVYKKVNEYFKPLIYKIPVENVNFKATAIILIGNICRQNEFDESSLNDLRRWLTGLTEGDNVHDLIIRSVDLCLSKLSEEKSKTKKNRINRKKIMKRRKNKTRAKRCKKTVDIK